MFEIDHLMVEVSDPLKAAKNVAKRLGLPFAWPLMKKDEYTSIGVNFGDINIEFINFRVRFGVEGTAFSGFSGIAFKAVDSLEESIKRLNASEINFGSVRNARLTQLFLSKKIRCFPRFFLLNITDTSGWIERLKNEFAECSGGKLHIGRIKSLSINQRALANLTDEFQINTGNKNQIFFESRTEENAVISDLIENLEIIIA